MSRIQQEYERELNLKANHNEELKRSQLQAENELKEVHAVQISHSQLLKVAYVSN